MTKNNHRKNKKSFSIDLTETEQLLLKTLKSRIESKGIKTNRQIFIHCINTTLNWLN